MSMEPNEGRLLEVTLATWIFQLFSSGVAPGHEGLDAACAAVRDATDSASGDVAGAALVDAVAGQIASHDPAGVIGFVTALYGDRAHSDMGDGSRDERTLRIRKYQFGRNLPWLARVWERRDGTVKPTWLLITRVTDEVTAADPNPWNDIDEERHIPVGDFHVQWELDGCTAAYVS